MITIPDVTPKFLDRKKILHATAACLRQSGYDATTIRHIASVLACAVGSIYRYFHDKRELMVAVTEHQMAPVLASIKRDDRLEQSVSTYIQQARAEPQMYRLMFWLASLGEQSEVDRQPRLPPIVDQIIEQWTRLLGNRQRARQCWSTVHGGLLLGESQELISLSIRSIARFT